jgi:hypothetical protein
VNQKNEQSEGENGKSKAGKKIEEKADYTLLLTLMDLTCIAKNTKYTEFRLVDAKRRTKNISVQARLEGSTSETEGKTHTRDKRQRKPENTNYI